MLHLVFCWHFHQPDYRDAEGRYQLPWTYLHAVKDYADMAAHLESAPNFHCVVNFVPTLTAQLLDYNDQFETGNLRDPLLSSLIASDLYALPAAEKRQLIEQCFKVNHPTMLEPFPAYKRLYILWKTIDETGESGLAYLSEQYLADLVTWYHLVWTGETVRRARPDLLALITRGEGFSRQDRRDLFELYGEVIASLLPRYRQMAERGQIELSATPHSHPILPLLLDFQTAREARPDLVLPQASCYPGGEARAQAHIEAALAAHQDQFGQRPAGFWPAEGGVSDATVRLFSKSGVKWAASGEGVLRHSLAALLNRPHASPPPKAGDAGAVSAEALTTPLPREVDAGFVSAEALTTPLPREVDVGFVSAEALTTPLPREVDAGFVSAEALTTPLPREVAQRPPWGGLAAGVELAQKATWCYTPYKLPGAKTTLFFRDDHLSDLIGFEYKSWHGSDATRHFLHALDEVRRHASTPNPVVSIILDGENAWEYYPFNGFYFLSELFAELSEHAAIRATTFSEYLGLHPRAHAALPHLVAGSWVYGDFCTWIGDAAKNRGWDWLVAAKRAYDGGIGKLPAEAQSKAEALLKSCESSDWFWWFGDYNPADAVASFDRVYRQKLKRLYETLRVVAPVYLDSPLCQSGGDGQNQAESGGVMRRGGV